MYTLDADEDVCVCGLAYIENQRNGGKKGGNERLFSFLYPIVELSVADFK